MRAFLCCLPLIVACGAAPDEGARASPGGSPGGQAGGGGAAGQGDAAAGGGVAGQGTAAAAGLATAARCDGEGSWTPLSVEGQPSVPRGVYALTANESEVFLWGGESGPKVLRDGAVYHTGSGTWSPLPQGLPGDVNISPNAFLAQGRLWLVGQKAPGLMQVVSLDPSAGQWTEENLTSLPYLVPAIVGAAKDHFLMWNISTEPGSSAPTISHRYSLTAKTWTPMATEGQPSPRKNPCGGWSGKYLVVWGGERPYGDEFLILAQDGARYDPDLDVWSPISEPPGGISFQYGMRCFMAGKQLFLWRKAQDSETPGAGAFYDPDADTWTMVPPPPYLPDFLPVFLAWTGDRLLGWRRYNELAAIPAGDLYDPATGAWTPMSSCGAPAAATDAIWTGKSLFVWNGSSAAPGGLYTPDH